jgi:hypothetical protein
VNGHIRTDPICVYHRPPKGRISTWWFDRHRGLSCPRCGICGSNSRLIREHYEAAHPGVEIGQ